MKNLNSPIILFEGSYSSDDVVNLKSDNKIWKENDIYKTQLEELFELQNPSLIHTPDFKRKQKDFVDLEISKKNGGNWIYFPWSEELVHAVSEEDFFSLRTNRNKNLINKKEQEQLYNSCVGFVGLSIGSHFALGLAHSGIAKNMKLAEFDDISTSNLNRLKAGLKDVGTSKLEFISHEIYNINPYANLTLFNQGLKADSLESFFETGPKLDFLFEAIDNFEMKIRLRIEARKQKVPVVMLTNLSDNLLIDIERFDQNSELPLFNGLIGNTPEEILNSEITEEKKIEYAIKIVGKEHLSERVLDSLKEINKTLVGRPQLYSTVSVGGGFGTYLARKLILDSNLKSGRYFLSFDKVINLDR